MKKTALIAVALMLLTSTAFAKDMRGKFGVGYQGSLGGAQGLGIAYWVTNALAIDAILGLEFASPDVGDTQLGFNVAIGARYNIARAKDVNLGFGILIDLGFVNKAGNGGADSSFQANIELPLTVEYFFSEHFAINLATGITIAIVPEKGEVLTPWGRTFDPGAKGFGVQFFNGGLFGSAGFKFYF